ncbi:MULTISPECIES: P-loop ATPase, Sll1717 family [unclassified Streptomyces]|uniref:P-loop ATPase, Sll1717 family n=1 Tax=unclassified Streptomyces TaxID=2593676 RepID=UPI0037910B08
MEHKAFLGYSKNPADVSQEILHAANVVNKSGFAEAQTWEATPATGRLIIETVLRAIDDSTICLFDVSTLSENVLFEVGYAFSRQKHLLLSVHKTPKYERDWRSFDIFSTIGRIPYETGSELAYKFMTGMAAASEKTLWDDVSPSLDGQISNSIFYVPTYHTSEAERNLRRIVSKERDLGTKVTIADPAEQGSAPLSWYVNAVYSSTATLLQMSAEKHDRNRLHNARTAFIAGLARGLNRPLLIVVDEEYQAPVDYKDTLFTYHNKKRLTEKMKEWLSKAFDDWSREKTQETHPNVPRMEIATELKELKFGDYVAENESDTLDEYFVETAEYEAVLRESSVVFVGRKGMGKSANMIRASQVLRDDRRNLVCLIRPTNYDLDGLVDVLQSISGDGNQSFLVESFWRFLLYSEVAITTVAAAERLPAGINPGTPISTLRDYLAQNDISDDFSVRLEKVIEGALLELKEEPQGSTIQKQRERIAHVLHGNIVGTLRRLLGEALRDRHRVALLVDNLDSAWTKTGQLQSQAVLLVGLLGAVSRIAEDFQKENNRLQSVNVTISVFLRADIYDEVIKEAREPDKINTKRIDWNQPELLKRVMDERYLSARPAAASPDELWRKFFCTEVDGTPTLEHILATILPRPRDLVYFCKAAVQNAANARHSMVEETDIYEAEKAYSNFAVDALLVEYGSTMERLEDVIYEFTGSDHILSRSTALELISAGLERGDKEAKECLDGLLKISFLGIEVREGEIWYPERADQLRKAKILARNTSRREGREERYQIHPAYRNFLVVESSA